MKQETSTKTRKASSLSQSKLPFGSTSSRPSKSSSSGTSKADILISIKPVHMNNIVERKKNHEFRKYLISNTVERMWFYVSSPDSTLRYIATIGHGKSPGEIEDEEGLGNADFNAGLKVSKYGYEIKELYQLNEPLALTEMKERYGASCPQRFSYVSEKMIGSIVLEEQIRLF
ncbi:hypothetical protein GALMADRAFT_254978 [Galerina marginata CBS 339.88]|uniref:Uncharacterized protein n=1 Tax=Galerina marginata (strain CBS 339.88) TaxID=685588 RepID=A0A067SR20_GALM3|nr:hypothetical protein GALMADRAFT_254978 [Galerina marginata CBS 339.88]